MTQQQTLPPSTSIPRAGYLAGALANAALLGAVHVWPGWQETPDVLRAVDAVLAVGIVVNLLQLLRPPAWVTPMGTLATSAVGLVATMRVLDVFPFAFAPGSAWEPVLRVALVVGVAGSGMGVLIALVQLLRLRQVARG